MSNYIFRFLSFIIFSSGLSAESHPLEHLESEAVVMKIKVNTGIKKTENMIINLQAYFDTIKKKTGKTPADFKKLAEKKGFISNGEIKPSVKATEIFKWLKEDFELGRGHAMAIYHSFKEKIE